MNRLVPLILLLFQSCGCETPYVIYGKVTDQSGNPLAGVELYGKYHPERLYTTTNSEGRYQYTISSRGAITGNYFIYKKNGYVTQNGTPYTDEETAAKGACQNYAIERNIVLVEE